MVSVESETSIPRLRGKALRIYSLLLVSGRPLGVREIQRRLRLSSPSLVTHHLGKMLEADLVSKNDEGNYVVARRVKSGVLGYYFLIGNKLVHRFYLYLAFFLSFLISTLLLQRPRLETTYLLLVVAITSSITILAFEVLRFRSISKDVSGRTQRRGDRGVQ